MINIIGTELYQWDIGRSVKVTDTSATHVHFANVGDSQAVIMELSESQALIPDYLLQTGKQLRVYAVANGVTIERNVFAVTKRERPESYVYDEDHRNFIYELIQSAEDAIADAKRVAEDLIVTDEQVASAVDKLNLVKTVNGIEPDENGNVEVNAQPKTLVVSITSNADGTLIPSHTPSEIYAYVQSGGIPVADYDLNQYSHYRSGQSMQRFVRYITNDKGMLVREELRIALNKATVTQDSDATFVEYLNEFVDEKLGVIENGSY